MDKEKDLENNKENIKESTSNVNNEEMSNLCEYNNDNECIHKDIVAEVKESELEDEIDVEVEVVETETEENAETEEKNLSDIENKESEFNDSSSQEEVHDDYIEQDLMLLQEQANKEHTSSYKENKYSETEVKDMAIYKKENTKNKNLIKYSVACGIGLILGGIIFSPNSSITEKAEKYDGVILELKDVKEDLSASNNQLELLEKENEKLQSKVKEAAPWFELSEKQRNEQLLMQAEKDNSKYLSLIKSNKSYYNMTKNEREIIDEWIDSKYEESNSVFQETYKDTYNSIKEDRSSSLSRIEDEKQKAEEEARKKAEAEKYNTGLTWEQIAREGKIGTLCQFKGRVLQVIKGDGFVQCRVATKGNYDDVMLIEVHNIEKTILEDDIINFKGMSMGTMEYTTVLGAEVSIPAVLVDEYTLK